MIHVRQLAASGLLGCTLAWAQQPATEIGTTETNVTFSTGVNLVPVKVVVRDKQGRAVGNLQASDFVLTDKGKSQTIARFSMETEQGLTTTVTAVAVDSGGRPQLQEPAQRPAVIPERFIAYVFDDIHTDIADLIRAREAAVKQLGEVLDPSTRVAVYVSSGQTTLEFTDDLEEVRKTIRSIRRWSADTGDNDCPPLNYYWADLVVKRDPQALAAAVANVKICNPHELDPAQVAFSLSLARLAQGQREIGMGLSIISDVARRMAALPGNRSIVYVSSGFILDQVMRFNQQRVLEEAIKAKVVVNTLDARGLYTITPANGLVDSDPALVTFKQRMQMSIQLATNNVLAEFSNATGGTFVWNSNAYEEGFRRLSGSPEFTYVLGFAPSGLKYDGSFHELKVTLKDRPGLDRKSMEIFARSGYFAPNALADAEETSREEIRDAVFARDELVEVPVELSLQYFKSAPLEGHLTVLAKVDLSGVRFRKNEERNNNILTVVSAVFDNNGNFIKGVQRVLDMRLRNETLDKLVEQGGISVRSNLDLPPGRYLVRLVVRDSEGKAMAMRNGSVEIPF
ncbi:MAG: VWA domain-containing protein [Acidobacteriota bacterium]